MKKLLIVTSGLPASDRRSWSGIPFSIRKRLEAQFDICECTVNRWGKSLSLKETSFRSYMKGDRLTAALLDLVSRRQAQIIQKHIRTYRPDCVLCFEVVTSNALAYLRTEVPVVYYTDSVAASMIDYYWFGIGAATVRRMNRLHKQALENCTALITASHWAKDAAVMHYGTDPGKITVVPFGANLEVTVFTHTEHDGINLLFVGIGWERKGADTAIACADWLNRLDPSRTYTLHLVGSMPPEPAEYDHVKLYGFLNRNNEAEREQLEYLRSAADFFILPTRAECAGIVFCEACAYGLPSITYDTGGIADYVINEYNGYRMPCGSDGKQFAEKILELLQDQSLLPQMKQNARTLYETTLNWDSTAQQIKSVIDALTDQ